MTDQDRSAPRFAAYHRAVSGEVRAPGVEAVHRAVLRRQRRRTALAMAAVIAVAVAAFSQFALGGEFVPLPAGPTATPSPSMVRPSPSGAAPSPSSSSSSPTPGPGVSEVATAGPDLRAYPVVDGPELHVVALASVSLRPVDGAYRGTVNIDVYNSGRQPYTYLRLHLSIPEGVRWDTTDGSPTLGGCGGSPAEWICGLNPVPAGGGRVRLPFQLVTSDFAPGSAIPGFAARVVGANVNSVDYADATPDDNRVEVRLLVDPG
jgi:hypothetical protein